MAASGCGSEAGGAPNVPVSGSRYARRLALVAAGDAAAAGVRRAVARCAGATATAWAAGAAGWAATTGVGDGRSVRAGPEVRAATRTAAATSRSTPTRRSERRRGVPVRLMARLPSWWWDWSCSGARGWPRGRHGWPSASSLARHDAGPHRTVDAVRSGARMRPSARRHVREPAAGSGRRPRAAGYERGTSESDTVCERGEPGGAFPVYRAASGIPVPPPRQRDGPRRGRRGPCRCVSGLLRLHRVGRPRRQQPRLALHRRQHLLRSPARAAGPGRR